MLTTYTSYQLITRDLQKSLDRTASSPVTARETKYYLENIGKVKSIDDFLGDYRLYSYAMKAFGLEDMTYAKAFMRKVLTEGVDDTKSFANKLTDKRYKEFATAFNFARYGELATTFEAAKQGTVDKHIRQKLELSAGEDDQGVRLALYFARKAPGIKNAFEILADPALLEVVQTAFSIPKEVGTGSIDAQAAMIKKRLDLDSLKNPKEVERFLKRFTIMWDAKNNQTTSPVLTLFTGASSSGLDMDSVISLQNIKRGGF